MGGVGFGARSRRVPQGRGYRSRRNEINTVGIDFDYLRALGVQPVDHFLQQLAADLRDARRGIEIGEMSLGETEVAVEAVNQDFEGVLESLEDGDVSYPAVIQSRDGLVHICYSWKKERIRHLIVDPAKIVAFRDAGAQTAHGLEG